MKQQREARALVLTILALLVLAGASWALAHARLGPFAPLVALGIAAIKALLVVGVFMRVALGGVSAKFSLGIALGFIALLSAGIAMDVLLR